MKSERVSYILFSELFEVYQEGELWEPSCPRNNVTLLVNFSVLVFSCNKFCSSDKLHVVFIVPLISFASTFFLCIHHKTKNISFLHQFSWASLSKYQGSTKNLRKA